MKDDCCSLREVGSVKVTGVPGPEALSIHSLVSTIDGGRIFLSDEFNHRVIITDCEGRCQQIMDTVGREPATFWYPRGLALLNHETAGVLAVCDAWNHRIVHYDFDGRFLDAFGSIGDAPNQFDEPCAVVNGSGENFWVLDRCHHQVKEFSSAGSPRRVIGEQRSRRDERSLSDPVELYLGAGIAALQYGFKYPLAFDRYGPESFVVADTSNRRLLVVSENGLPLHVVPLDESATPPFCFPDAVTHLVDAWVLVGAIGGAPFILNLDTPWRRIPVPLATTKPRSGSPAAFFRGRDESGVVTFTLADGGALTTFSFNPMEAEDTFDPDAFQKALKENDSRSWNTFGAPRWRALKGDHQQERIALIGKEITVTRTLFEDIFNLEKELNDLIVQQVITRESVISGTLPQAESHLAELRFAELRLNHALVRERHTEDLHALVAVLSSLARLLFDPQDGGDALSEDRERLIDLLDTEFQNRNKDVTDIWIWLRENLKKTNELDIQGALYAASALSFCKESLRYVGVALRALGKESVSGDKAEEDFPPIPETDPLVSTHTGKALVMIGALSEALGYNETAANFYRTFTLRTEAPDEARVMAAAWLHLTSRSLGSLTFDDAEFEAIVTKMRSGAEMVALAGQFQTIDTLAVAQRIIDYLTKGEWANELQTPSGVTLLALQKGVETLCVRATPIVREGGGELRYVASHSLWRPLWRRPLAVAQVAPLDATRLIVTECIDITQPFFELHLYDSQKGMQTIGRLDGYFLRGVTVIDTGTLLCALGSLDGVTSGGLKRFYLESGRFEEGFFGEEITLPENLHRITSDGAGGFIVTGQPEVGLSCSDRSLVWRIDAEGKESRPLGDIRSGVITDVSARDTSVALALHDRNEIAVIDITSGADKRIATDQMIGPHGVTFTPDGGMVALCAKLGLIRISPEGETVSLAAVIEGEERYLLNHTYFATEAGVFSEGDILLSDSNGYIHTLTTG